MPTKKIADIPIPKSKNNTRKIQELPKGCQDPDHNVPMMQYFSPGIYEHECPTCHKKKTFEVPYVGDFDLNTRYDDESPDYIRGSFEEH